MIQPLIPRKIQKSTRSLHSLRFQDLEKADGIPATNPHHRRGVQALRNHRSQIPLRLPRARAMVPTYGMLATLSPSFDWDFRRTLLRKPFTIAT